MATLLLPGQPGGGRFADKFRIPLNPNVGIIPASLITYAGNKFAQGRTLLTTKASQPSNTLIWILCIILALSGIGIFIHAGLNFNQAEVVVEWTTASELNTVGFNLLRGETPAGPFEQVNPSLIPSSSDTLTGNSYSYEDAGVTAGKTYFYMLEEIENTGGSNQHGPIVVKASRPATMELIIGGLLVIGALIYIILLKRDQKQPNSANL
jgi:hypothetical protein